MSSDDSTDSDTEVSPFIKSRPMYSPPKYYVNDIIYGSEPKNEGEKTKNKDKERIGYSEENVVPDLPQEIILTIAKSNPHVFLQMSKTSKLWKKEYNKERDRFYDWILNNEETVNVRSNQKDILTREELLNSLVLTITLMHNKGEKIPNNWDFLPNLKKLFISDQSTNGDFASIPFLPRNLNRLWVEGSVTDIDNLQYAEHLIKVSIYGGSIKRFVFPPHIIKMTCALEGFPPTIKFPIFPLSLVTFKLENVV